MLVANNTNKKLKNKHLQANILVARKILKVAKYLKKYIENENKRKK